MAQFSHPEFGGMSQWSRGMTMVGDMFNDGMRLTLNALASELSAYLANFPATPLAHNAVANDVSYASRASSRTWWPADLGTPHSTGGQNNMRYAIFAERLAIDDHGTVTVYDTDGRDISGIAQAQGSGSTLTFTGQTGLVRVSDLRRVG